MRNRGDENRVEKVTSITVDEIAIEHPGSQQVVVKRIVFHGTIHGPFNETVETLGRKILAGMRGDVKRTCKLLNWLKA